MPALYLNDRLNAASAAQRGSPFLMARTRASRLCSSRDYGRLIAASAKNRRMVSVAPWIGQSTQSARRALPITQGARRSVSVHEHDLHDLMARSLNGDNAAYSQFLDRLSGLFRAFFRRKLLANNTAYAEDLVQETLLAIHLHRQSYDPNRPVTAWVYAIARYKLIDHFRRSPGARIFIPVDDVDDLFSDDAPDATDPARDVDALLQQLPTKQSTAIRLVKLEDLTAKEAAQRMGVSEADVKISIHRGLRKLMALVAKEETHEDGSSD